MSETKIGIVLSGGGARGAYQVGVLWGLSEILKKQNLPPRVRIYSGVSAGAINAGFLASNADDFHGAVTRLVDLWSNLSSDQVFASDAVHMGKIAMTWATELGFGAMTGTTPGKALLDTSPLRQLLLRNLDFSRMPKLIQEGHLDGLVLTALDYHSSNSISFVQGVDRLPNWNKSRRRSEKSEMSVDHVMASAAIPLLFPAAKLGDRWYGDGCVRNSNPCAPSIYMGANRLLVVGVRRRSLTADDVRALVSDRPPSVARVLNVLLNAVLLDGVEVDIERMERVNEFVRRVPEEHRGQLNYRALDHLLVSPSADIGELAAAKATRLPRIIRYLLKGLGNLEEASEIISYLLFDPIFCRQLIELGREDAFKQDSELLTLFS